MSSLTDQIEAALPALPIAEQKMARHFLRHPQATILGSAAQIAQEAGASDATVVRTARSLGFDGLAQLRSALLQDLVAAPRPAERVRRTIEAAKEARGGLLTHVLGVHRDGLAIFEDPDFAGAFERSITALNRAPTRHIFGVGPSGALADYAALQFNRLGLRSTSLNATGIALADRLLPIQTRDVIMIMAYAPIYREVTATLDRATTVGAKVVLVSDSLGPLIDTPLEAVLPVPRGRAGHLATHGATMVLIDAMIAALAARRPDAALSHLSEFADLRGALDRSWSRRGVRASRKGNNE